MKIEQRDSITEELWNLAEKTPSKYDVMHIRDGVTGLEFRVDQSLDSTLAASPSDMEHLITEFLQIHLHLRAPYTGELDGVKEVQYNNITIRFEKVDGVIAYKWLKRYIRTVLLVLQKDGMLNLKEIEESVDNGVNKPSENIE
jgi:hypothetical protein